MKSKVILAGLGFIAAAGLIGAGIASAKASGNASGPQFMQNHGARSEKMLQTMAQNLGISEDSLKAELNSGKPFYKIAVEHGVTYDTLRDKMDANMKSRLDDMVKSGFITQAEEDAQLQKIKENEASMPLSEMHRLMGGMHMGFENDN